MFEHKNITCSIFIYIFFIMSVYNIVNVTVLFRFVSVVLDWFIVGKTYISLSDNMYSEIIVTYRHICSSFYLKNRWMQCAHYNNAMCYGLHGK